MRIADSRAIDGRTYNIWLYGIVIWTYNIWLYGIVIWTYNIWLYGIVIWTYNIWLYGITGLLNKFVLTIAISLHVNLRIRNVRRMSTATSRSSPTWKTIRCCHVIVQSVCQKQQC